MFPLYEPHSGQAGGTVKEGEKASHPIIETKLLLPLWLFFLHPGILTICYYVHTIIVQMVQLYSLILNVSLTIIAHVFSMSPNFSKSSPS